MDRVSVNELPAAPAPKQVGGRRKRSEPTPASSDKDLSFIMGRWLHYLEQRLLPGHP